MYIEVYIENQNEFEPACRIIDEAYTYDMEIAYQIIDTDYLLRNYTDENNSSRN